VLGARSDAQRNQEALKLLNYGFENFDSVLLYGRSNRQGARSTEARAPR